MHRADRPLVIGISVCGASHEKAGQPCQDMHYFKVLPDGTVIAAVADGAGSAALGGRGAELSAKESVEMLCAALTGPSAVERADGLNSDSLDSYKDLLRDALISARQALEREASEKEILLQSLAATLIIVIATQKFIAAAQIGDGIVIGEDREGKITSLTRPARGEYINETIFLTSTEAIESAYITVYESPLKTVAILSDGLQMLALRMPECMPHSPFFVPLFRFVEEIADEKDAEESLREFLTSPRIRERTDDDITIVIATFQ